MNEEILQYMWQHRKFGTTDFLLTDGTAVEIIDFGGWNHNAGPDFLFAKISVGNTVLAGHIEMHVRSSDWLFHGHSGNPDFGNVILHAVYEHDCEIPELAQNGVPTLELKSYIDQELLYKYAHFLSDKKFIPCEDLFSVEKIPPFFTEQLLLKRLDDKAQTIAEKLKTSHNDAEAVLFRTLAYAFGLKVNAAIFEQLAESLDFGTVRKISRDATQLHALFYGLCGWLDKADDDQTRLWQREFNFLKIKYNLGDIRLSPKFSKLRPPAFPTIRLSQLAELYHKQPNLFSAVLEADNLSDLRKIFTDVKACDYWDTHYTFGKETKRNEKRITDDFADLLLINAVLPVRYAVTRNIDANAPDDMLRFYSEMLAERNSITESWQKLGAKMTSALDSQAFLYQHKNLCQPKKCLNCGIGHQLLKHD